MATNGQGHFTSLDEDECRHLLRGHTVGRVAWQAGDADLLVLPVNYVFLDDQILFRTSPTTVLAQLADPHEVAFQVDEYDDEASNGWSVLVQGTSVHFGAGRANPVPTPWAPGPRNLVIAINASQFSGRAVSSDE